MIDITTLRAMAAAGASVDVILAAVEAELVAEGERVQARRAKDAERQRQWRSGHPSSQSVTVSHSDVNGSLSSLLSSSTSTTKQVESTKVSKKERARKSLLPDDWQQKPSHYELAKKYNFPPEYVDRKADALRDWAGGKGIMRANWDQVLNGFIRPKEGQSNGFGGSRPLQDDSKSISRAAGRLAEAAQRGEFTFGPRPSLLPQPDTSAVLVLPKR